MTDQEILELERKGIKIYPRNDSRDIELAQELRALRIKRQWELTHPA